MCSAHWRTANAFISSWKYAFDVRVCVATDGSVVLVRLSHGGYIHWKCGEFVFICALSVCVCVIDALNQDLLLYFGIKWHNRKFKSNVKWAEKGTLCEQRLFALVGMNDATAVVFVADDRRTTTATATTTIRRRACRFMHEVLIILSVYCRTNECLTWMEWSEMSLCKSSACMGAHKHTQIREKSEWRRKMGSCLFSNAFYRLIN